MTLALVEARQGLNFSDISGNGENRGDQIKILLGLHIDWVEAKKEDIKDALRC